MDGFSLMSRLVPLPGRYYNMALEELALLRRDPSRYQCKLHVVPENLTLSLDAYGGEHIHRLTVVPGTILYGVQFAVLTSGGLASDLVIQIALDGEPISAAPVLGSAYAGSGTYAFKPCLLPAPTAIAGGLIEVKIANRATAARVCQLVLCCAEPIQ